MYFKGETQFYNSDNNVCLFYCPFTIHDFKNTLFKYRQGWQIVIAWKGLNILVDHVRYYGRLG